MKLKNKKTGEIGYPYFQNWKEITCVIVNENAIQIAEYTSLAELNEEWEDYEEPKEYWWIDYGGRIKAMNDSDDEEDKARKQIGNYFETREEAEKAVEKLKAWKRLKDKGFRFTEVEDVERTIRFEIPYAAGYDSCEAEADLELLFGGGE